MKKDRDRAPPRMTEAALADAAVRYLGRYAASSGSLKRVLTLKVRRSAAWYGDDPAPLVSAIEAELTKPSP